MQGMIPNAVHNSSSGKMVRPEGRAPVCKMPTFRIVLGEPSILMYTNLCTRAYDSCLISIRPDI